MSTEAYYAVALSRVPSVGAGLYRALTAHFGSPRQVLEATPRDLRAVAGVAERIARRVGDDRHWREADAILHHAERNGIGILRCGGPDYPPALAAYATAPAVLYHRGETDFSNAHSLAVVGTRKMSAEGGRQVERMLDPLTEYRPLIVSGLAYGVDVAAHRRALLLGLPTLGVLGSGLDHLYPQAHRSVARRMAAQGGGVLTEYPYWQKPEREHFPARNRIVAMLSEFIVVVESGDSGGSIITANMGREYNKGVGACPGRGGDPLTAGCNALIRSGRAHLIDGAEDIVARAGWGQPRTAARQLPLFTQLSTEEQAVVERLKDRTPVAMDELLRSLGGPPARLAGLLFELELREVVTALPGQRYRLAGS